ncbi:MAG: DUF4126 domain-containing protein [Nostocoides sp.]
MGAELLPWVFTSGWASGINAYAVVLVMGLADRIFGVSQIPHVLARTDVLIAAGVMFAIEMVADKVPFLDTVWDAVHTVIRPVIGATIGYLIGHQSANLDASFLAAAGGFSALASHVVKAGVRAAVNTSPEPASNVLVSTAEDAAVIGVVSLGIDHPMVSAGIAAALLVLGMAVVVYVLTKVRRWRRTYDDWGVRHGIGEPRDP